MFKKSSYKAQSILGIREISRDWFQQVESQLVKLVFLPGN